MSIRTAAGTIQPTTTNQQPANIINKQQYDHFLAYFARIQCSDIEARELLQPHNSILTSIYCIPATYAVHTVLNQLTYQGFRSAIVVNEKLQYIGIIDFHTITKLILGQLFHWSPSTSTSLHCSLDESIRDSTTTPTIHHTHNKHLAIQETKQQYAMHQRIQHYHDKLVGNIMLSSVSHIPYPLYNTQSLYTALEYMAKTKQHSIPICNVNTGAVESIMTVCIARCSISFDMMLTGRIVYC